MRNNVLASCVHLTYLKTTMEREEGRGGSRVGGPGGGQGEEGKKS